MRCCWPRGPNDGFGQQLPLGANVECVRYAPISGPYLKLIDWPERAISGCEQMQQTTFSSLPRWIRN